MRFGDSMAEFNIFKIDYDWYEGEHYETLLGKEVSTDEFEKDLIEAKKFAISLIGKEVKRDYLGKGYSIECLPEFYSQIIWYLTNRLKYVSCKYDDDAAYAISDDDSKSKITVTKSEKKTERKELV